MRIILTILSGLISLTVLAQAGNQNQDTKPLDPVEAAYKEAAILEERLSLESYQVFFVDSILQSNLAGLKVDLELLKNSGTTETTAFKQVQEKWQAKIDSAYRKVFTDEQMIKYLKYKGKYKKDKKDKKDKHKKDRKKD